MTFSSTIFQLRVREIIEETPDVATFVLEPQDGVALAYKAGQFFTFIMKINGHEIRRSYSLSSAPSVDRFPAVTIKRVDNGEVSRYWMDVVKIGDIVHALQPAGRFLLSDEYEGPAEIVLIGGGSGIVPLFSILKETLAGSAMTTVILLFSSQSERKIIFYKQLEEWQKRFPHRLKIIHMLSQPSEDWTGQRGRLNNTRLENLVKGLSIRDQATTRFFLCGPSEMMRTAGITLKFLGFEQHQILKENFAIEKPPLPRLNLKPHNILMRVKDAEYKVHVSAHSSILDAALEAKVPIPYSCKGGRCSSCAAIRRAGKVHMTINEVLTDRELDQGWILTCTAYADDDDVVIDVV